MRLFSASINLGFILEPFSISLINSLSYQTITVFYILALVGLVATLLAALVLN